LPLKADIAKALPIALGIIEPGEAGRCIVFTDDPNALGDPLPPRVSVVAVGGSAENVGIVAFDVDGADVYTAILNNGPARDLTVELLGDGRSIETKKLHLAARAREDVLWAPPTPDDELRVKLNANDALDADNTVVALHRPRRTLRVALIGPESEPLRRAFNSIPEVVVTRVADPAALAESFDLCVFYSVTPESLPSGFVALVGPDNDVGPLRIGSRAPVAELIAAGESPLLKDVDLAGIRLASARPAQAPGLRAEAVSEAGTLIGTLTSGDSTLLYVGFDFSSGTTDWPLRWSFPVFWSNVVDLARGSAESGWVVATGEVGAANLLDEGESALGGTTVAFSPDMLGEAPKAVAASVDLSPWLAAAALVLLLAHWTAKR